MINLSRWAIRHASASRIIIAVSQILIAVLAIFIANQFSALNIHFPFFWLLITLILFFSLFFYFSIRKNVAMKTFWEVKALYIFMGTVGFFLVMLVADRLNQPNYSFSRVEASMAVKNPPYKNPEAEKLLKAFETGEKTSFTRKEKRIIREEFKYQLKKFLTSTITGNKASGDEAILIILSCIAAGGLLFLVAGLACNLSCNGSDAAALIVGIIGTAAVIFGLVVVIKAIHRSHKKQDSKPIK